VNAITKQPSGAAWEAAAAYRLASAEDSQTGRAEGGFSAGDHVSILAGGSVKSYGNLRAGSPTKEQRKTGYDEWDADAKVVYRLDEERRWVAAFQRVTQNDAWRTHRTIFAKSFHGSTVGTDRVHTFDQQRDLGYLQYHADQMAGAVEMIRLSASYQFQGEDLTRVRGNGVRDESDVNVHTAGFWTRLVSPSPVGTLTYGAEYYRDWVGSGQISIATNGTVTRAIQGPVGDGASYDLVGVYLQDEIPLGSRVELILGSRYTYARAEADRVRDPVTGNASAIRDDWHNVVGSGRIVWRMDEEDRWRWFGGASQGFRAPNLSDLTRLDIARSGEIETAAPGLEPEKFLSLETGVKTRAGKVTAEAAYFYTFIDDMIVRQPTGNIVNGATEVTKRNSGEGFVHGVEVSATWQLIPQVAVWGWGSWMEGKVDGYPTSAPVTREEYLSRVLPLSGGIGLRWESPAKKFWAEFLTTATAKADNLSSGDKADTQRIPPGGTPGYAVLSLRGGWRVNEHFVVAAALENILDKDYRVHGSGVNEPGRNAVVTASIRY
jgi:hemoglobin/transferrin/lactoferrin receptor protein